MADASRTRLESLDAFRGATVAAMLLVNNPGSWGAVWAPLRHAPWHGWTPTDLIFPFFLFVVGITTGLAKKEPGGILRRGAVIVLAGLLLNAFPFDPGRLAALRVTGVLQRIGIVYVAAAFITRWFSRRMVLVLVAGILLGYWGLLMTGPLEPPEATVTAALDRTVIGERHLWAGSRTWDPEGILSTIPAVATALAGFLLTPLVRERKTGRLALYGALMAIAGWAWGLWFPVNKSLWTSSYVLLTAGLAAVLLAGFIATIDVRGARRWAKPFVVFGVNPLIAFLGSGLMARLLGMVKIEGRSLHTVVYSAGFKPYFAPQAASFLFALSFVLVWLVILALLDRRGVILKA